MPLALAWSVPGSGDAFQWSAPAIHDHTVYYSDNSGSVAAADLGSGLVLWRRTLGLHGWVSGGPAIAYGNLYVPMVTAASGNGSGYITLFALDPATGATHWRSDAPFPGYGWGAFTTPSVAAGTVFWSSYNGQTIVATDALTGRTLWTYRMSGWTYQGPTYWAGMVYAADDAGNLVALDAMTGAVVWAVYVRTGMSSAPTLADGTVFIGDLYGTVRAFDAMTGGLLWSASGLGFMIDVSSVTVAEGLAFVGAWSYDYYSGWMFALDVDTGATAWSYFIYGGAIGSSPAYNNGTVFVATMDGNLYALDAATGVLLEELRIGTSSISSPALADGYLVLGDQSGALNAFGFVGAGVMTGLAVTPSQVDVPVTGATLLSGGAFDAYGNRVPVETISWSVLQGLGTILPFGASGDQAMYIAGVHAGVDAVRVTSTGFTDIAIVNVLPAAGNLVVITPGTPTIQAGGVLTFSGSVTDRYGNAISGATVTWTASASAGTITAGGVLTASTTAGTGMLTATSGSLSASVTVTIVPGPLASVVVNPTSVNPAAGSVAILTAAGEDAYGNPTGSLVTWSTTAGIVTPLTADGTVALYVAPTTTGVQTVTASSGTRTASASVTVVAGPLAALVLTPATLSLAPGGTANLHLSAEDAYGNAVTSGTFAWSATTGTVQATGGGLTATYTAGGAAGSGTITVTSGGKSAVVAVVVTAGTILEPQALQGAFLAAVIAAVALAALSSFFFWKYRGLQRKLRDAERPKENERSGGSGGPEP